MRGSDASPLKNLEPLPNRFSTIPAGISRRKITSSESETITLGLVNAENDLKAYNVEINRLKANIMVVESRRDGLTKSVAKYRSLLSPIHRVPEEILAYIFSFCCDENTLNPGYSPPFALTASAVCGRWRDVVLETPHLWSTISIHFESIFPREEGVEDEDYTWGSHQFTHVIRIFMERSKTAPLDLEFYQYGEEKFELLEAGLTCLMDHSNRWRSLKMSAPDHPLLTMPSAFQRLRGHLSNLQHFLVDHSWSSNEMISIASDLDLLSECPLLTSIELRIRADVLRLNPRFPWSRIQSLKLVGNSLSQVGQTLASCNNLQQLELSGFSSSTQLSVAGPITTLGQLRYLSFERVRDDEFYHFFQSYNLPSLSHLKIRDGCLDLSSLEDFFVRSSCSITSLTLELVSSSDVDTLHLLRLVPNLTTFSFEEQGIAEMSDSGLGLKNKIVTTTFLEQLAMDTGDESTRYLPQLEDLTLSIWPLEISGRRALQHMLASRSTGRLRKFTLTVRGSKVSAYESLQCFRDVGMQIQLSVLP
ncbi:hypothetical protein E1B28_007034 [Marasmius oreades]|uniref:F-box domain-containing protein n=1 Tax=Marasmius oreades TaxID=181124 RepID=A0A9P7S1E3_9AGAR|nr:uncharacterized protein E1B28_007034 [Marasmius oreades]KAG7093353.1 hypothetical protein E1B28_007034 [Marasmius oreades]